MLNLLILLNTNYQPSPQQALGEVSAMTATVRMTPVVTTATGGARLCHCRYGIPGTIGNCISKAGSQGPVGCESPLFFVPVSLFLRIHRNRNALSDQLGLPSGPHIFLARPEGQLVSLPSKTPSFAEQQQKSCCCNAGSPAQVHYHDLWAGSR